MKVVERIFEYRIRQQIEIDDTQFGFMKGKGTTDAIFMARQMQESFQLKIHTHNHLTAFVRDNPGRPVPEETLTHSHPT